MEGERVAKQLGIECTSLAPVNVCSILGAPENPSHEHVSQHVCDTVSGDASEEEGPKDTGKISTGWISMPTEICTMHIF
ncbi:hypothetical protein CONPUDRAFT_83289 [Coniophora puteana RWD-64-598 SS2]|uniref:Uncharacterized protein n=1 Tax=Coniophora puteana (strain RWD-64-598) TaxID=741705 RepID=A0A5M3M9G3_CONPW|nr:uncharacterized protein CONPUDRAFT_83289 [Coniophora puteana RWD-64-598 SS2]XP_007773825.1 uncharacterized protein CONPUDRAFT_85074 [Coniophora puteana RWD-64-598 SS2]EIW75809.1 hypothetical protein CONPUDRAFT_85074 [Coniophora puteana RWD-64-598 SS2]EIW78871.1 hypothetical protein CONPUDRAFT_83289 [Coniophora puteana RWD-64-598 SS2]